MGRFEETLDALFGGKLMLAQSRAGYRFALDTLLLADFVTVKEREKIVDLGTGNGVIPLILASRHPSVTLTGVELQPGMVERARRNIELNGMQSRIQILQGDVRAAESLPGEGRFDAAVCNPPYRKPGSGRISPMDEKRIARHETQGELGDFARAGARLLRGKGRLAVVYPAERAMDLLTALRQARTEPKRLRAVHSFAGAEACLVLVEAVKGGKAGLVIEPPLIIYERGHEYTDEVATIIRGHRRRARSRGKANPWVCGA